ncbi:MAG TPA: DUF1289 domain-containing protein [Xanthobacteraceae bacterium]|nr:DUF1289 domain-containing protein [Xanthobacteraceae bacterium]
MIASPCNRVCTLVSRTRSSHDVSASPFADFGFKSGTSIIELASVLSIPKFAQSSLLVPANFGIGTLDPASGLCLGCGRSLAEIARWTQMSDAERERLLAELDRRLAARRPAMA